MIADRAKQADNGSMTTNTRTVHDPLCLAQHPALANPKTCVWCEVIDKVMARENAVHGSDTSALDEIYVTGYETAIDDVAALIENIERLPLSRSEKHFLITTIRDTLDTGR